MILSDNEIKKYIGEGKISVDPYDAKNLQGATLDLRLGDSFLIPQYFDSNKDKAVITLRDKLEYTEIKRESIIITPGEFILGTTYEKISLDSDLCGRVDGKSGIGRKGLFIECAGHVGPGFEGQITLEIYNANRLPFLLTAGEPICQMEFHELSSSAERTYKGRYQGQKGAQA